VLTARLDHLSSDEEHRVDEEKVTKQLQSMLGIDFSQAQVLFIGRQELAPHFSTWNMPQLQYLDLSLNQLIQLPSDFGNLVSLKELCLKDCRKLAALPDTFSQLIALKRLDLSSCCSLTALPECFGQLAALEWLNMDDCHSLQALPASFSQLVALQYLDIRLCRGLAVLSGLTEQPDGISSSVPMVLAAVPTVITQLSSLHTLLIGCAVVSTSAGDFLNAVMPEQPVGAAVTSICKSVLSVLKGVQKPLQLVNHLADLVAAWAATLTTR
jgi:hypothetical protein